MDQHCINTSEPQRSKLHGYQPINKKEDMNTFLLKFELEQNTQNLELLTNILSDLENIILKQFEIVNDMNYFFELQYLENLIQHLIKIVQTIAEYHDIQNQVQIKLESRVWGILKKDIELRVKLQELNKQQLESLDDLFQSKIQLIQNMIKGASKFRIQQENLQKQNSKRSYLANLYSYLGELFQFRSKICLKFGTKKSIRQMASGDLMLAAQNYDQAVNLYPYWGNHFYLLSVCSYQSKDIFHTIYYSIRAYLSTNPKNVRETLLELFEEAKNSYNQNNTQNNKPRQGQKSSQNIATTDDIAQQQFEIQQQFQNVALSILRFQQILFTKIDLSLFQNISLDCIKQYQIWLNLIQKQIQNLQEDRINKQLLMEFHQMSIVLQLVMFGLYYQIEGYNFNAQNNGDSNGVETKKSLQEVQNHEINLDCLKYSFAIILHTVSFIENYLKEDDLIDICINIVQFLVKYDYYREYVNVYYKNLNHKFKQIYVKVENILIHYVTMFEKTDETKEKSAIQ